MIDPETTDSMWEYTSVIWYADMENDGAREYAQERWPDWTPPRYSPSSLIPALNRYGEQGWELVSLRPILVDTEQAVLYPTGVLAPTGATHRGIDYLCVFRRMVSSTPEPSAIVREEPEAPWAELYDGQNREP